ncbi:MAG: DUF3127 domain-containing protein [Bacteroidales bacterium]|nr:DUF3127 domain-containing protein [Bacteroidales bacterium]MCF8454468.1 DUF3127 domain-containing protein [Bacteroidales bacterium]
MNFELTGKIIQIMELVQVSDRFKKQEFVIEKSETTGNFDFTDYIKFQLTQDRTSLIQGYSVGDVVKVAFNIRGNKWEKQGVVNYFTNLDAWRIEKVSETETGNNQPPPMPPIDDNEMPPPETSSDDLPF